MMRWLAVLVLCGAALGLLFHGSRRPAVKVPEAPPLTAEEEAAGLKIGAAWDSFKILSAFETAEASRGELAPEKRVLATEVGGHARAYPIDVLNHHELISDSVGGVPLLVSY